MGCESGIAANITSDCTTQGVGGIEVEAYIMNRSEFTPVFDVTQKNLITSVAMISTKQAFKITGVKKNMSYGYERSIDPQFADRYIHKFRFNQFEISAASLENVDNIKDVVIIVENKNKASDNDGTFNVLGVQAGMYVSADTKESNDNNGIRLIELQSQEGEYENYSSYVYDNVDYATSKAALEALLIPAI